MVPRLRTTTGHVDAQWGVLMALQLESSEYVLGYNLELGEEEQEKVGRILAGLPDGDMLARILGIDPRFLQDSDTV